MRKTILGLAIAMACVLGLGMASEAQAGVVVKKTVSRGYYREHGTRYNGGWYFRGREHNHWSYRVWNTRYHRYHYYEPTLRIYYYYDDVRSGYYPCD